MDVQLSPSGSYANIEGHTGGGFNDLPVQVAFRFGQNTHIAQFLQ